MTFQMYEDLMVAMDSPSTDLKQVIKDLVNKGYLSMESLAQAMAESTAIVINGLSISKANYNKYVELNKINQAIPSIKEIRMDYGCGLKEAKDINDEIKNRIGIRNYY